MDTTQFKDIELSGCLKLSGIQIVPEHTQEGVFVTIKDENANEYISFDVNNKLVTIGTDVKFKSKLYDENSTPEDLAKHYNVNISKYGDIKNENYWMLNANGSGSIANNGIKWDANGNITFSEVFFNAIRPFLYLSQGLFNPTTSYKIAEIVSWNGSCWICKKSCTGILPNNSEFWGVYISKGETGPRGPQGETGRTGRDGRDGRDGVDGRDGRDGNDGHSRYYIDLTNDTDTVASDEHGLILTQPSLITTECNMYFGATFIADSTIQIRENIGCVCALVNNKVVISSWTEESKTLDHISIVIDGYYGGTMVDSVVFTISKVKGGINARINNLQLSHNVIIKHKDKPVSTWRTSSFHTNWFEGASFPVEYSNNSPVKIIASDWVRIGNSTPQVDTSHFVYYQKDGSSTYEKAVKVGDTFEVNTSDIYKGIKIFLFEEDSPSSKILDVENVNIISDGQDGHDGSSGYVVNLTNDNDSIPAPFTGTPKPADISKITTKPQLFYGMTEMVNVVWETASDGCTFQMDVDDTKLYRLSTISKERATTLFIAKINGTIVGSALFTVNIIRGGATGDPAVIYRLVPSCDSVSYDYMTFNPSTVLCDVHKCVGNNTPIVNPSDVNIVVRINDGVFINYMNPITITDNIKTLTFEARELGVNGKTLDRETIPVVKDGKSPYFINLTNDNDSIAHGKTGFPDASKLSTIRTKPQLFLGQNIVTENLTWSTTPIGCTIAVDSATGEYYLTTLSAEKATVKFTANLNSSPVADIIFTVTLLRGGDDIVLYKLQPICDVIAFNGTSYNPATVTCKKMKYVGNNTGIETTDHNLRYKINDGNFNDYTSGITIPQNTTNIEFIFIDSNNVVLDREYIPVVSDGKPGTDGNDGRPGTDGTDGNDGRPGTDGKYMYILPSDKTIVIDKQGMVFPSIITGTRYERNGNNLPITSSYGLFKYKKDDGPLYDVSGNISTSDITKYLTLEWKDPTGNVTLDKITIPVVRDGNDGNDGAPGSPGVPGTSNYFHVRYSASADGADFSENPNKYIGTVVTGSPTAPTDKIQYKWVLFEGSQGPKGDKGIAGDKGDNGLTPYLHIKYSNDGGTTFTGNNGEDVGNWLGQCVDYNEIDPITPALYKWALIKGSNGNDGRNGSMPRLRGLWDPETRYVYNSEYRDIVLYKETSATEYKKFAVKTYGSSLIGNGNIPTNVEFWTSSDEHDFISTGLLLTKQAVIDNLITRSLQTNTSGARINISGTLMTIYGSKGEKNIEFGIDDSGMAVMKYFDNFGNLLYNLGPKGIDWGSITQESYMPIDYICLKTGGLIDYDYAMNVINQMSQHNTKTYYNYSAGNSPTVTPEQKEKERYVYTNQSTEVQYRIPNGYYGKKQSVFVAYQGSASNTYIKPDPMGLYPHPNGIYDGNFVIYFYDIYQYNNGELIKVIPCFWSNGIT